MEMKNKMGYVPINKLMFTMGVPMILSMVVQAFYNIVDTFFISNITSSSIADLADYAINALTLAFPIQMLMVAIGVGTGVGVNSLLSKYLGEKNYEKASLVAGNAIFTAICMYILFLVFGFFGVDIFLKSQTSNELVLSLGSSCLKLCCILSFGSIGSMIYEKLLQSTGKTHLSTIAQLAGAVTNIILDPILIFGLFGLPKMDIVGAALATVIGQILTLVLDMIFHYYFNREIDGKLVYLKPNKKTIIGIYRVGIPAIIMQSLMSVMSYGINIIYGLVSETAVTAFGIYYKIQQFVFFAAFGINNAMIPIIAFNYGKQDKKRVKDGIKYGIIYTLVLMAIGLLFLEIFADPLAKVFSLNQDSTKMTVLALQIVPLGYLFAGANIAFQGIYQALGFGIKSLILSLVRLIIVTLPVAWIFTLFSNADMMIWWAFPLGELIAFILGLYFQRKINQNCINKIKDN